MLKDILEIVVSTLTIVKLLKELEPKNKRKKDKGKSAPTKGNAKQRTEGNATSLFHPYIYYTSTLEKYEEQN